MPVLEDGSLAGRSIVTSPRFRCSTGILGRLPRADDVSGMSPFFPDCFVLKQDNRVGQKRTGVASGKAVLGDEESLYCTVIQETAAVLA